MYPRNYIILRFRYLLPREMDFLVVSEAASEQCTDCALFIHLALAFRSQLVRQLGAEHDLVSTFTAALRNPQLLEGIAQSDPIHVLLQVLNTRLA